MPEDAAQPIAKAEDGDYHQAARAPANTSQSPDALALDGFSFGYAGTNPPVRRSEQTA